MLSHWRLYQEVFCRKQSDRVLYQGFLWRRGLRFWKRKRRASRTLVGLFSQVSQIKMLVKKAQN